MSGCGYQGYEFGARYLDSICIDGQLWDADNCTADHQLYEPLDYKSCPVCQPLAAMDEYAEGTLANPDCKWPRYYAWYLVNDICKNRDLPRISWMRWMAHRLWGKIDAVARCFRYRLIVRKPR